MLGRCLKIDSATLSLRRPSVARVLIEMDVSKLPPKRVWIGEEQEGFWQEVVYESWPKFCGFCHRFGHDDGECFRKHPALKMEKREVREVGKAAAVFRPKGANDLSGIGDKLLLGGALQCPGGPADLGHGSEGVRVDIDIDKQEYYPGAQEAGKELEREVDVTMKETGTKDPGSSILVEETETPALLGGEAGMGVEVGAGENCVSGGVFVCPFPPDGAGFGRAHV